MGEIIIIIKYIKTIGLILILEALLSIKSVASYKVSGIENFPEGYKPYLETLHNKHPNWNFIALYTNLDWDYVVNSENIFGKNLVPKSYSDNWKNRTIGEYNLEVDSGWVDCSRNAIEYALDVRNFLNEVRIFQFETLSYDNQTNNIDGIEKILYGTEFYNRLVNYKDSYGNNINTSSKYSELILSAGEVSGVSSYHLASRIKQEVGPFLSHSSISGIVEGYEGLYNFYNIGATSSTLPLGAIKNGLRYARDGKGADDIVKRKYLIPWVTKELAITGGAIFIGSSYINRGQNTVYLQKFDVNDEKSGGLFWHQYMTNVLAPYSESKSIYNGYVNSGLINSSMSFIIPIYNNMPYLPCETPNIQENDFINDNTKMYANVSTTLNVRSGPSTSYEVITSINSKENVTRIAKGNQNGELWDRVILQNGIVGYVYQSYLKEQNFESYPEFKTEVKYTENGYKVEFDRILKYEDGIINGINTDYNTVEKVKQRIKTDLNVEIVNYNNQILANNSLIGTGSKILVLEGETIIEAYPIILYGDINGDGKINSIDLLVLQRYILGLTELKNIFIKAGNISKNGKEPSSLDLLLIQRHILGLKRII